MLQGTIGDTRPTRVTGVREGWGGCAAIAFSLLGVMLCVGLAWGWMVARRFPRALDQYFSLEPGQVSLYRVTYANGTTGFYATNTVKPDSDAIAYTTVYHQGGTAIQVHTLATNWQGQAGEIYSRDDFYAREGDSLYLIAQHEGNITTEYTPPALSWSSTVLESDPATPLTGQVTFNNTSYVYALWLDGRESVTLPDGDSAEALRVGFELFQDGTHVYHSLNWYVAGVGQVRGEVYDGADTLIQRLDLLASTRLTGLAALPMNELVGGAGNTSHFFRENAARTGAYPDADLPDVPFSVAYHLTLDANFTASPAIADGLLIVADQNGTVFGYDAETGEYRWHFGMGGAIVAAPAISNGLVYVGGSDKTLFALTAREGLFVWSFKLRDNVSTSPVVSDGVLFVGGEDRMLYALDASTGVKKWSFAAGDRVVSSPAIADGRVFFGADDGVVYALDANTGVEVWRAALDAPIVATPAVDGGVVYVGSTDTEFAAFSATSGEMLWKSISVYGYKASPAVGGMLVFAADDDGFLRALQRADGEVAWEWRGASTIRWISSPLLLGSRLIIVDDDGVLHVFDAETGTVLQNLPLTQEGVTGSPVWDGTTLYLTTQDRRVFALRPDTLLSPSLGVLWDLELGGVEAVPYAPPLEVAGTLYGVTHDGSFWRADSASGQETFLAHWDETVEAPIAYDGSKLYIGTLSGNLYAFDIQRNSLAWQRPLTGAVRFAPTVQDGRVYVHTRLENSGIVYALDAASGAVLWQVETQTFANNTPFRAGAHLIVSGEGLLGLDPATGEEIWRGDGFVSFGGTLAHEGVVFAIGAGLQNETVIALDAATGDVLWRADVPGVFIFSRPALDMASRMLVIGSTAGIVYGLDSESGALRWEFTVDGPIRSDVQIQNGSVYLTSANGTLYVLNAKTGGLLANARLGSVFTYAPPLITPERAYVFNGAVLYALELAP